MFSKRKFSFANFKQYNLKILETISFTKYNILSNLIIDFNNFIDKLFAISISVGGVSALSYGDLICIT